MARRERAKQWLAALAEERPARADASALLPALESCRPSRGPPRPRAACRREKPRSTAGGWPAASRPMTTTRARRWRRAPFAHPAAARGGRRRRRRWARARVRSRARRRRWSWRHACALLQSKAVVTKLGAQVVLAESLGKMSHGSAETDETPGEAPWRPATGTGGLHGAAGPPPRGAAAAGDVGPSGGGGARAAQCGPRASCRWGGRRRWRTSAARAKQGEGGRRVRRARRLRGAQPLVKGSANEGSRTTSSGCSNLQTMGYVATEQADARRAEQDDVRRGVSAVAASLLRRIRYLVNPGVTLPSRRSAAVGARAPAARLASRRRDRAG